MAADWGIAITLSSKYQGLNMWPMQVTFIVFLPNINQQPQIIGFHNSVQSTTVFLIGIQLQVIYQLLEIDLPKKQGKVCWILDNE